MGKENNGSGVVALLEGSGYYSEYISRIDLCVKWEVLGW